MNEPLTQLHTEPFTAEREWTLDGIPVLTASLSLPQPVPGDTRTARRIRRFYQLQSRAYLRYCDRWLLPQAAAEYRWALEASRPLPCFHAELRYQVTYQDNGLWSLYTQSRETGLPGRTALSRRGDTWDLADGCPVPLGDLFSGRGWRKRLLAAAAEEITRQEAAAPGRYRPDWRRRLRRWFNPQNFYLTRQGLVFFYPPLALCPTAGSIPTFTIPYDEVRGLRGVSGPGTKT